MVYKELFQLQILHEYSSDITDSIFLKPTNETVAKIKKENFIFKKIAGGIKLLVPKDEVSSIVSFYVFPKNNEIIEVTDLGAIEDEKMLIFTNKETGIKENELTAVQREITEEEKEELAFVVFKPLLKIEIDISKINSDFAVPEYKISLRSKTIKWTYYFIGKMSDKVLTIKTIDGNLSFNELNVEDEKRKSLKLNFPEAAINVFESSDFITITKRPIKEITLLEDEVALINHLPNPKISDKGVQVLKIM